MHDYQRTFSSWDVSSGLDSVINLRYSNIFVKLSGARERKCSAFKIHRYLLSVNLRSFDYIMSKWFVKINFGHKIIIAPLVTVTIVIRVVQKTKTSSDLLFFFEQMRMNVIHPVAHVTWTQIAPIPRVLSNVSANLDLQAMDSVVKEVS